MLNIFKKTKTEESKLKGFSSKVQLLSLEEERKVIGGDGGTSSSTTTTGSGDGSGDVDYVTKVKSHSNTNNN